MSDFQQQYALWDKSLNEWPTSRLATMPLDECSKAGSKESVTYWPEPGLDEPGSRLGWVGVQGRRVFAQAY